MVEWPSFSVLVSWLRVHNVHISANISATVGDKGERNEWLCSWVGAHFHVKPKDQKLYNSWKPMLLIKTLHFFEEYLNSWKWNESDAAVGLGWTLLEDMTITLWVFCFKMNQTCTGNAHQSSSGSVGCLFACAYVRVFSSAIHRFAQASYFSRIHRREPVHQRARSCVQPFPYVGLGNGSFSPSYILKPHIPWYLGQQKSSLEREKIKSKTTLLQFPKILWLCHEVIHRILWKIWFNVAKMQRRSEEAKLLGLFSWL